MQAQGTGLDLRAMHGIYTHPTIVIFCEGRGIATACALIQAPPDGGGLNFEYRQDVRMYYRARLLSFSYIALGSPSWSAARTSAYTVGLFIYKSCLIYSSMSCIEYLRCYDLGLFEFGQRPRVHGLCEYLWSTKKRALKLTKP